MYTSVSGHTVDCSEVIQGIYIYGYSCVIPAHELAFIYGICVVFERNICCAHTYGDRMVNKS